MKHQNIVMSPKGSGWETLDYGEHEIVVGFLKLDAAHKGEERYYEGPYCTICHQILPS
jgi:hypothetical protein